MRQDQCISTALNQPGHSAHQQPHCNAAAGVNIAISFQLNLQLKIDFMHLTAY